MDLDADPRGPKKYGSYGSGYGSATLIKTKQLVPELHTWILNKSDGIFQYMRNVGPE